MQVILEQANRNSRVARAEVAGTPQNDNPYNRENAEAHDQRFHPSPSVSCLPTRFRTESQTYTACFCETSIRTHFRPIAQASSRCSSLGPAIKIILFEAGCFPASATAGCARAASLNLDGAIGQERNMEHPTTYAGLNRRECVSRIAGIML